MNMKEAIEFVKCQKGTLLDGGYDKESHKRWDRIIELLQHGEKFEQMWRQLTERVFSQQSKDTDNVNYCDLLESKQIYFPEPIKKTITIDKDLLSDQAKEITKCFREWIKDHLVRDLPITPEGLAILSDSIIKGIENSVKNIKEGD